MVHIAVSMTNREKVDFDSFKKPSIYQHVAVGHNISVLVVLAGVVQLKDMKNTQIQLAYIISPLCFVPEDFVFTIFNVKVR